MTEHDTHLLTARLIVGPDTLRKLLGLPDHVTVEQAAASANGELIMHIRGVGRHAAPPPTHRAILHEVPDFGRYTLTTIEWEGLLTRQLT